MQELQISKNLETKSEDFHRQMVGIGDVRAAFVLPGR
jgi:hypothetical protein